MLATGVSLTAAATITLAPLPAAPLPSEQSAAVVLTGAWQDLETHLRQDFENYSALLADNVGTPILNQIATNFTTYGRWMAGQDGGTPELVVRTIVERASVVAIALASYAVMVPLSFVGPVIAPAVTFLRLVADTAKYPSTPQTVLQAFIDVPAVYLDTTLNCCSAGPGTLSLGLLNPGPLGYLLALRPAIAFALQIPAPTPQPPVSAAADAAIAAQKPARVPGLAKSARAQSAPAAQNSVAARSAKRPDAARKTGDAKKATAGNGKGQSARPGNREKR